MNVGKYGNIEEAEDGGSMEVNKEKNLSDKVYEQEQRFSRPSYGGSGGYGGNRSYGGGRDSSYSRGNRRY